MQAATVTDTPSHVRAEWVERIAKLEARRDAYANRFVARLPSGSQYETTAMAVEPDWLEAQAAAADAIAWQLDHERG